MAEDNITDVFEGHSGTEASYGILSCVLFVTGTLLNLVVCWDCRKRGIRTPVDVAILLICASNWVGVLLDLFVGISYINNGEPMAFGSVQFTVLWWFAEKLNNEWLYFLVALLAISNTTKRPKKFTKVAGILYLAGYGAVLLTPLAMQAVPAQSTQQVRPYVDDYVLQNVFPGNRYIVWIIMAYYLPHLFFHGLSAIATLWNMVLIYRVKIGGEPTEERVVTDTITCIAVSSLFLVSDIPDIVSMVYPVVSPSHAPQSGLFFYHLFVGITMRAVMYPGAILVSRHGPGCCKVLSGQQVRYRRFRDDDSVPLREEEHSPALQD